MGRRARTLSMATAALACASLFSAVAGAQQDVLPEFAALFGSAKTEIPTRMYYEWEVDTYPRPLITTEDNSPSDFAIAGARNRAEAGVITFKCRLWLWSDDLWRFCGDGGEQYPGQMPWSDVVCDGRMGAQFGDSFAIVIDPKNPPPEQGREVVSGRWQAIQAEIGALFAPGRDAWTVRKLKAVSATRQEDSWTGIGRSDSAELKYSGDFASDGSMVVRSIKIINDAVPYGIGFESAYTNDVKVEGIATHIATHWLTVQPNGKPYTGVRLIKATPITSRTEVEQLIQIPEKGMTDPLRGELNFTSIVADYRPDKGTQWQREGDGERTFSIPVSQMPTSKFNWVTLAGWILAGGVVAGIVAFRMSKHRT